MDKTTICNGWDRIKEELCVGLIHMMHEYTLHWRWRRRQRSAVTESYLSLLLLILNLDESICSAVNYRKWNFRLKENGRLPTKADIRAVYCDVALMKYVLFSFTPFFLPLCFIRKSRVLVVMFMFGQKHCGKGWKAEWLLLVISILSAFIGTNFLIRYQLGCLDSYELSPHEHVQLQNWK